MAITNTDRKVIHNGNGSAVVFPYGFPILDAAHLSVIYTGASGTETTLSPALYTVSGIGASAGGSVTYPTAGSPIATGTKLTIVRTVPYTQTTVLSNQGGYYPEVVERRFDEIYMAMQQLAEIVSRYTVSSISDPATEQSNYALIQSLQTSVGGVDRLTTQGDLLTRDGAGYKRLPRGTAGQFLGISGADAAWQVPAYPTYSGVRQSVSAGPVTTAGLPSLLPSTTTATLNLTSQNVSSTYPLVATAAGGWSSATGAPVDTIGYSTTNLTWSSLTASSKNYLYVTISGGVMTTGKTLLAPIYQWGGTPSTTNGQFTFNIGEMRGYLGNGTTAPQTNLVFVGEADTSGTAVTATIAYAYNGKFEGSWSAGIPNINTTMTADHNLGVIPRVKDWTFECTTNDQGYLVGEQISMVQQTQTSAGVGIYHMQPLASTRNSMHTRTGTYNAFVASSADAGVNSNLTQASWKKKPVAERGW